MKKTMTTLTVLGAGIIATSTIGITQFKSDSQEAGISHSRNYQSNLTTNLSKLEIIFKYNLNYIDKFLGARIKETNQGKIIDLRGEKNHQLLKFSLVFNKNNDLMKLIINNHEYLRGNQNFVFVSQFQKWLLADFQTTKVIGDYNWTSEDHALGSLQENNSQNWFNTFFEKSIHRQPEILATDHQQRLGHLFGAQINLKAKKAADQLRLMLASAGADWKPTGDSVIDGFNAIRLVLKNSALGNQEGKKFLKIFMEEAASEFLTLRPNPQRSADLFWNAAVQEVKNWLANKADLSIHAPQTFGEVDLKTMKPFHLDLGLSTFAQERAQVLDFRASKTFRPHYFGVAAQTMLDWMFPESNYKDKKEPLSIYGRFAKPIAGFTQDHQYSLTTWAYDNLLPVIRAQVASVDDENQEIFTDDGLGINFYEGLLNAAWTLVDSHDTTMRAGHRFQLFRPNVDSLGWSIATTGPGIARDYVMNIEIETFSDQVHAAHQKQTAHHVVTNELLDKYNFIIGMFSEDNQQFIINYLQEFGYENLLKNIFSSEVFVVANRISGQRHIRSVYTHWWNWLYADCFNSWNKTSDLLNKLLVNKNHIKDFDSFLKYYSLELNNGFLANKDERTLMYMMEKDKNFSEQIIIDNLVQDALNAYRWMPTNETHPQQTLLPYDINGGSSIFAKMAHDLDLNSGHATTHFPFEIYS